MITKNQLVKNISIIVAMCVLISALSPLSSAEDKSNDTYLTAYEINLSFARDERVDTAALDFYRRPSKDIQSDDEAIVSLVQRITFGLYDDYSKALALHDWVCDNIYYDYDYYYGRTEYQDTSALNVLSSRKSVCAGYANLLASMLRAANIPAKKVSGFAVGLSSRSVPDDVLNGKGESNHAWNEAYVNGRWIIIDATWDSNNRYEYGCFSNDTGCYSHRYFDISQECFAEDHVVMTANNYYEIYLYLDYGEWWDGQSWHRLGNGSVTPVLKNGITYVPVRAVVEAMGGSVVYVPPSDTTYARISCRTKENYAQMWIGYDRFYIWDTEYQFTSPPIILNGSAMVPLRTFFEAMGCIVSWDSKADDWHGRILIEYAK